MSDQYRLARHGDVARRLELHKRVDYGHVSDRNRLDHGRGHYVDYARHPHNSHRTHFAVHGRVHPRYSQDCFRFRYWGPSYFSGVYWYPRWSPWVRWSWNYDCDPLWDPRPVWSRPVDYVVATPWVVNDYPAWSPLPVVSSGTWVDVPQVSVPAEQYDLQMLAVRFVDPGHPDETLGPRYRVWFRNNSSTAITQPFNVTLFATRDGQLTRDAVNSGARVTSIEAGETKSVDIRLPFEAVAAVSADQPPFTTLHAVVDANRELGDVDLENNGSQIPQSEVFPVDPAAFQVDPVEAPAGGEIMIAGEGFGPQPGKVLLNVGNIEMEAEILGWYDLGVRLALPSLPLAAGTKADVIVLRADGAAANPIEVAMLPPPIAGPAIVPPALQ